ncbi:hypothetical protein GCM10010211_07330 [Streptomyces albospinus]|uniref:Uncharacterized protein n=1 Tax=Streptomyces albospinus TaxID=285515 RepID=A0ABQ2UP81_9ACTN|nr:hypothetical protein GCM10010211_07330 [Streptomyces albospinus]
MTGRSVRAVAGRAPLRARPATDGDGNGNGNGNGPTYAQPPAHHRHPPARPAPRAVV